MMVGTVPHTDPARIAIMQGSIISGGLNRRGLNLMM